MRKESYDYEVKARAREIYRKFIKKNLGYSNQNLKVVCFPGEEAIEIHQVYDKLAIPRGNIVGLERDKKIYKKLKSDKLGINLFYGTDEEFFEKTKDRFDIISLDYQGKFNDSKVYSLALIARRQILNSKGILATTFFGQREGKYTKTIYEVFALNAKEDLYKKWSQYTDNEDGKLDNHPLLKDYDPYDEKQKKEFRKLMKDNSSRVNLEQLLKFSKLKMKQVRDLALTSYILKLMGNGRCAPCIQFSPSSKEKETNYYFVPALLKLNPNYDKINRDYEIEDRKWQQDLLLEFLSRFNQFKEKHPDKIKQINKTISGIKEWLKKTNKGTVQNFEEEMFKIKKLRDLHYKEIINQVGEDNEFWVRIHLWKETAPYFPIDLKKVSYENDAGSLLYLDFIYFDQKRELFSDLANYVSFNVKEDKLALNFNYTLKQKEIESARREFLAKYKDLTSSFDLPDAFHKTPRLFLGSSYKPKAKKEEVARMLLQGTSEAEIKSKFRIKNMSLAGIKASITKGHYDHLKPTPLPQPEERVIVTEPTKEEQESIKKQKTVDIYQSILLGLPNEEIIIRHNLQKEELAAHKAVIKRGANKDLTKEAKERIWQMDKKEIISTILRNCRERGIYLMQNGYINHSNDIMRLKLMDYEIKDNGENCGLYILTNASNNFRYLEDICLQNSEDFFIPSILASDNSCLKDKLKEFVSAEKELGLISRIFFHQDSLPLFSKKEKLEEVLENSFLVR